MIPTKIKAKQATQLINATVLFVVATVFSAQVFAAPVPDAGTMLANFAQTIPNLMKLVTAIAYVMGMAMIVKGVLGLKQFGEARTMMSSQHELKGPLAAILVGAALLYLPSSVQVGLNTFWTNPNPYGYLQDKMSDPWSGIIQDGYMIVQLVGTIAFIRGLLMLTHASGHHAQPGTLGKAMAYIISGVLCINLYEFINVINNTLSLGQ